MNHISTTQAAKRLGITRRRVNALLAAGRIPGAYKVGETWVIPGEFEVTPPSRKRRSK